jgi:hypothetical protein
VCDLRNQRIIRIRITEERTNAQKDLAHRESRRPILLENIEADDTGTVDIRVVDLGRECTSGRLEWVIHREEDLKLEYTPGEGRICGTEDYTLPPIQVILLFRTGRAIGRGVGLDIHKFTLDSTQRHSGCVKGGLV